jgi:transposase
MDRTTTTDPAVLADLAHRRLRVKLPALRRALEGRFRPHHAFLLRQIFAKIDFLEETIAHLTQEIDARVGPFEVMLTALDTIPGVDRIAAIGIVRETSCATA